LAQTFERKVGHVSEVVSVCVQIEKNVSTILETFNRDIFSHVDEVIVEEDGHSVAGFYSQAFVNGYTCQTF